MNGTFMFGEDRFGPQQDYLATYRAAGGDVLSREMLSEIVTAACAALYAAYEDFRRVDDFPSVSEVLRSCAPELSESELRLIEQVIARHEIGQIPDSHADCLRRLAKTHRLGLVSNLWSQKDLWLQEFQRAGIAEVIEHPVFSSDGRSMKPSSVPFEKAIAAFRIPRDRILFVGDSHRCDIEGAHAVGIASVWLAPAGSTSAHALAIKPSLLEIGE